MWGEQPSLQVVQGHPGSSPRICEGQHPEKGEQEAGVETGYGAFPWAVPPSSGLWAAIAPEVVRVDSSAPHGPPLELSNRARAPPTPRACSPLWSSHNPWTLCSVLCVSVFDNKDLAFWFGRFC